MTKYLSLSGLLLDAVDESSSVATTVVADFSLISVSNRAKSESSLRMCLSTYIQ